MAVMIPTDSYFDPKSGEKEMFLALKQLPNDYYVFHSYRLVQLIPDKGLNENEIDFLVFNPNYGCLFIECKNSKVERDELGNWYYVRNENGNIKRIHMKDPFNQAFTGQHNLFNKLRETYPEYKDKINDCKFMVGVWLPQYFKYEIDNIDFGPNVTKELIITREALLHKEDTIKQISFLMERMNKVHLVCKYEEELIIENSPSYKHQLSYKDAMTLYSRVLCPTFKAIINSKKDYEQTYIELLEEQSVILDFLTHQRTAAICGASGTGKTLVAVERARRLSNSGERVLFLCYNRNLKDWLEKVYSRDLKNVDFSTLDGLKYKLCKNVNASYYDLNEVLMNLMSENNFDYKHIIVDEGQDFGKYEIDEAKILELFFEFGNGLTNERDTSFFIFYDKHQLVNSKKLPEYLQSVDSKLTLYKNCRNTKNIANTAYTLINVKPVLYDKAWDGDTSKFILYSDKEELEKRLNNLLETLSGESSNERVIISCSDRIENSSLSQYIEEDSNRNYYLKLNKKKIRIYTCPTFKGLESDDVIIIDVSNKTFEKDNKTFYVAATRAKKRLFVFLDKNEIDFEQIINDRFKDSFSIPNKSKMLVAEMKGVIQ